MPKISVIVPVYDVEQYLPACVDSILAQTFGDFELILVDDGSPDNCGALCDGYAQMDRRVRVIHQENQGLSGARNAGVDIAAGEYLTFIDSDDVVSLNYLETLYSELKRNHANVACCKMQEFEADEMICKLGACSAPCVKAMRGRDAVLSVYNSTGEVGISACGKLYQSRLFEGNSFPVGKIHEDQAIIPIILYESERVAAIDVCNYFYRKRSSSITHTQFKANRFDNVEAIDSCIVFFANRKEDDIVLAAKRTRKKVNAILVILAESCHAHDEIPEKYSMSKFRALYDCYRYAPNDTYVWYLSQLYPSGVVFHEYFIKAKSILHHLQNKVKCRHED